VAEARFVTLPLARREELEAGYHVLWFAADVAFAAAPGQFAMVRGEGWGQAPLLPRPMSLLGGGREPSILIKVVGEGTERMARAVPGERYALLAPLGRPWRMPADGEEALFVAGGVGVAPLVYLGEALGSRGGIHSLYGGRTSRDLPLAERLEAFGSLGVTTEDGSRGTPGRVTVLVERELASRKERGIATRVYTCGPHAMMAAVAELAAAQAIPCEASLEAPMGCGYGVCLGCAVARPDGGYLYTCVDGPCVDAAGVDWSRGAFG
jgi:dihydroorotate dehydrogenase electron transfer subunit